MERRVGIGIVGIALASLAVVGSLRSETETAENAKELAAARVQVARRALKRIEVRRAASPVSWDESGSNMKGIVAWSRRLMEAETDVSVTKTERVAAVSGHLDRLKNWRTILEVQRDTPRGDADDLDLVQYYLLEAKELLIAMQAERE